MGYGVWRGFSMARYRPKVGPVLLIFQSRARIKLNLPALSLLFNYPTSDMGAFQLAVALYPSIKSYAEACVILILRARTRHPYNTAHSQWQQLLVP